MSGWESVPAPDGRGRGGGGERRARDAGAWRRPTSSRWTSGTSRSGLTSRDGPVACGLASKARGAFRRAEGGTWCSISIAFLRHSVAFLRRDAPVMHLPCPPRCSLEDATARALRLTCGFTQAPSSRDAKAVTALAGSAPMVDDSGRSRRGHGRRDVRRKRSQTPEIRDLNYVVITGGHAIEGDASFRRRSMPRHPQGLIVAPTMFRLLFWAPKVV